MLVPMDTCILELGGREIRLLRARLIPGGRWIESVALEQEWVGIDESVDRSGVISPNISKAALAAVLRLLDVATRRCPGTPVYAIAPHGLGGARNAENFLGTL